MYLLECMSNTLTKIFLMLADMLSLCFGLNSAPSHIPFKVSFPVATPFQLKRVSCPELIA